jgi:hypothetical protein
MMLALALLDLPFESAEHESEFDGPKMRLTAASPVVVFHEEVKPAADVADDTPILVSQNFFRHDDRYRYENNQRLDKYVMDEFLVHTVYGCQVVVTNPTSSPQKLNVLVQVPAGSVPVLGSRYTRTVRVDLQPYNTTTIEYYFYFPKTGEYPHYPVHVASNEQLIAFAPGVVLTVVEQLSRIDRTSWAYISQNGNEDEVMRYLRDNNLQRTNLEKIAWRMQERPFFVTVTTFLASQHAYHHTLWSYGIKHNEPRAVREFLQHSDGFVSQCGDYLQSGLLVIDPVVRKTYQHMDYRPLVNARAHQLGSRRQILNDRQHGQYHRLLKILGYRRDLNDDDLMAVTYYLLLQDRIDEALAFFSRVNSERLVARVQYDYFRAYLDFYTDEPKTAPAIAARYENHLVDRWRNAFASVRSQLGELAGDDVRVVDEEDRSQQQTQLAATSASFDFRVESRQIELNHQNLSEVTINYYPMDIELLFSRNPFVQQFSGQFSYITPNLSQTVALKADQLQTRIPLPEQYHNTNVLVEIRADGQTKSQAYYANSINLQMVANYGQLRVTTANPGRALPKVYVKVYARMRDGRTRFYKDGYTDLRGRFDYTSLNTNELDNVERFSLLVLSETHGATVREANPPKR